MKNRYNYNLVIQQNFNGSYGWEDVSEYEVNSAYVGGDYDLWKHDVKEYRLMGYPTRTIHRRVDTWKDCQCDYGHDIFGQVRVLPLSSDKMGGNVIVCYSHYMNEIKFRIERNKELSESAKFDLPAWESLKVYEVE